LRLPTVANFVQLGLNQGINIVVALVVTPILFQRLGEETYGLVNLGLSIVMLLSIMVNYGFNLNGPKKLALLLNNTQKQSDLINEVISTRLLIATLIVGIFGVGVFALNLFPNYELILLYSMIIILSEAFYPLFILQGFEKISLLSIANAFAKLGYLVAIIILIHGNQDAFLVNFLFGGASLLANVCIMIYIYRHWNLKFAIVGWAKIKYNLKENFQFFFSSIAGHISVHGGYILLSNFVEDIELGRYALAQRIAFLLRMVPVFLTQSILQHASRLFNENEKEFDSYLNRAYKNGLALTFLMGVLCFIFSPFIIEVVGGEYVSYSDEVLKILAFIPFFSMLNVGNMIRILVADRKEILAKATWITAISMLLISTIGSYYYGGYGLAIALLLTEILGFTIHSILLKRKFL
jgi:O-antigen/teichoic acid export membrane protein